MNQYEEESLSSVPTMAGGIRRTASFDEPSLGSAPTLVAGGPGFVPAGNSLGRIDQYELVRKLGGGGFGVVYLAKDTVSGIEVALKTLHPLLKHNVEEMDLLREKFALVARLSHPNIASPLVLHPVRDIMLSDEAVRQELRLSPGDSIMVMRYAPGVTLSKWRRQFPGGIVPLPLALEVGRQIASALDYAHSERIVHRDIKPANVVVETLPPEVSQPSRVQSSEFKVQSSGGASSSSEPQLTTHHSPLATSKIRIRILDFGLAAEIRSSMSRVSSEQGDTSGTRPYMAPEQWLGRKQDGRTDQYALASVLYELLSGAPPFAGVFETGDPIIMRTAVERDIPEEIDGLPPAVNTALLKALAKRPKERFASCGEFVKTMEGEVTKGGASSPSEPQRNSTPHRDEASHEAGILRRKLSLAKALKAISEADRTDKEFAKFIATAEDEMAVAEEACKFGRFAAAAESLDRAESVLDKLRQARFEREMDERKAKAAEAERLAREKAEAGRRAKEEAERKAKEELEAGRKAEEERNSAHEVVGLSLSQHSVLAGVFANGKFKELQIPPELQQCLSASIYDDRVFAANDTLKELKRIFENNLRKGIRGIVVALPRGVAIEQRSSLFGAFAEAGMPVIYFGDRATMVALEWAYRHHNSDEKLLVRDRTVNPEECVFADIADGVVEIVTTPDNISATLYSRPVFKEIDVTTKGAEVCIGAAIWGAIKTGRIKDMLLLNVTHGKLGLMDDHNRFHEVVDADTSLPTRQSEVIIDINESPISILTPGVMSSYGKFSALSQPIGIRSENMSEGLEVTIDVDARKRVVFSFRDVAHCRDICVVTNDLSLGKSSTTKMLS